MKALIVGASGLVGAAILRALGPAGVGTYLTRPLPGLTRLDARDRDALRAAVLVAGAEVIYVPAAQPNVEWCEENPAEARSLNLEPVRAVLEVAGGRRIVAFSTDYVFDGASGPYTEADATAPLSVYGRIKLELEELLLASGSNAVVRTTGVFGTEPHPPGKNFVLRLIGSLRRGEPVRVPSDQIANPTYAPDLAAASVTIGERGEGSVWHVAGPDLVARTELATRVAAAFGLDPALVVPVRTSELGQAAPRPLRSGLLCPRYEARFGPAGRPLAEALSDLRADLAA